MLKSLAIVSLLATSTVAVANAQAADPSPAAEQAPAPIVRAYQSTAAQQANPAPQDNRPRPSPGRALMPRRGRRPEQPSDQLVDSQPISGVWLRSRSSAILKTVSATPHGTEVRLERGILNVNVHQPAARSEILIDLPGGQTSLLKDGLYTFNADTNTVRVLHGEAAAFYGPASGAAPTSNVNDKSGKPIKIKEAHQLSFVSYLSGPPASSSTSGLSASKGSSSAAASRPQSVEAYPYELAADLLPASSGEGNTYASGSDYGYGDDGSYGYPYPYYAGAWGYPYGFYPYGVGIGFGYGYYGGFRGYRGGYYGRPFRR